MRARSGPIAEPEIHLLPAGFVGHVIIRHQKEDASDVPRQDGARIYRIPSWGVLETSARANYGVRAPEAMQFFAIDEGGARNAIPLMRNASADQLCIIGGYQVQNDFHYFVDLPGNADDYTNPALIPGERSV